MRRGRRLDPRIPAPPLTHHGTNTSFMNISILTSIPIPGIGAPPPSILLLYWIRCCCLYFLAVYYPGLCASKSRSRVIHAIYKYCWLVLVVLAIH
ncbi:hypothetical protein BDZ91DRAFT_369888 [Kalaharituber pfeilii]|nr:hypothetical protein BDZ91DRAFT_369888 [Kalaharituber pfeilii]